MHCAGVGFSEQKVNEWRVKMPGLGHPIWRRYGWPLGILLVSLVPFPLGLWCVALPLVSMWLAWLIAREPRVLRFRQKLPRLAALLPLLAWPPLVIFLMYLKSDGDGVALGALFFYFLPILSVPFFAVVLAMMVVVFQGRAVPADQGNQVR